MVYVEAIGQKPAPMIADFGAAQAEGNLYVATDSCGIAGFAVFYQREDHVHLENVAVAPARQGERIGRQLVEFVEARARELGLDRIELYTNEKMTGNLAWYPKLGFIETGRRQQDGFNRVFFEKILGNA